MRATGGVSHGEGPRGELRPRLPARTPDGGTPTGCSWPDPFDTPSPNNRRRSATDTAAHGPGSTRTAPAERAAGIPSNFPGSGRTMRAAMDRRAFLRYAGRTALGAAGLTFLGAPCHDQPQPAPTGLALLGPARAADWDALGRSFAGQLIRPGEAAYNQARELFD